MPNTNRTAYAARTPLTRERILRRAMELADVGGLDALSMRRLAQTLGVEAMSLYHHVHGKDDVLEGIADLVVEEFVLPDPQAPDWKATLRASSISAYDALVRHPWSAHLLLSGPGVSQPRLRQMEAILATLRRAGFSPQLTDRAYHALDSHVMGFALWVGGMNLGTREELAAKASALAETLAADEWPYLLEHVEQHLAPRHPDDEGDFAFGLELILDGLERLLTPAEPG